MPQIVTIIGKVRSASGVLVPSGRITVGLRSPLVDAKVSGPDEIWTTLVGEFTFTNGDLATATPTLQLLSSSDVGIPYSFRVEAATTAYAYFLQGGSQYVGPVHQWTSGVGFDNEWYTGSLPHNSAEQERLTRVPLVTYTPIFRDFDAIIPEVTTLEFKELIDLGSEFVSNPVAGLVYLAEKLTTEEKYRDRLRVGRWRGVYGATPFYQLGDVVSSSGKSFIYKNEVSTQGNAPPVSGSNTYWDELPLIVVPTASQDLTNYVRKDIDQTVSAILSLPTPGVSPPSGQAIPHGYADGRYVRQGTAANPVNETIYGQKTIHSTSRLFVPTRTTGDSGLDAASTAFVQDAIANAGRLTSPLVWAQRSANQNFTQGALTTVVWDTQPIDTGNLLDTGGGFVPAVTGRYLIQLNLRYVIAGTLSSADARMVVRAAIIRTVPSFLDLGDFWLMNLGTFNGVMTYNFSGSWYGTLTQGETYAIAVSLATAGTVGISTAANAHSVGGSLANNQVRIWRA